MTDAKYMPTASSPFDAPSPALQQTIRLLARLGKEKFFGKLVLSYEAGNVVYVRKEEVLKMTP